VCWQLTNLGLMESPDMEYEQEHLREDDVICAQLRLNQEALRKHSQERDMSQTGSRKRLRGCIEAGFQREKLLSEVQNSAKALTDCILPKFKYVKGIKPQDIKKQIDTWDRAYSKFKAHLANPTKRKAVLGGGSSSKKMHGDKGKGTSGAAAGKAGLWAGGAAGPPANAKAMASFHQAVHRSGK